VNQWTERLLRGMYSAVLYLLAPATVYHLLWRGFRQQAYLERWDERYAHYPDTLAPCSMRIWLHAVSVGEVNARLLVTTITPTGSQRVEALWEARVDHVYLPYDLSGAVHRFLAHFRPTIGLIVETELWPNLLFCCRDAGIPAFIVNARLSARSLRHYRLLHPLIGRALRSLTRIAAQTEADAERFVALGAAPDAVVVTGNLKYDIDLNLEDIRAFARAFRIRIGVQRPVWIAASTHAEEEAIILAIHRRLRLRWPTLLLLWAPRHPERFRPVMQAAVLASWRVATRKLTHWPDREDAVFVIDTLGELARFYACADVAFVGGSLQPVGGHNLLEPAALGIPIVTGPYLHNFADIAQRLQDAGAMQAGRNAAAVGDMLERLLADAPLRERMGDAGAALVRAGRGTLARTLEAMASALPPLAQAAWLSAAARPPGLH